MELHPVPKEPRQSAWSYISDWIQVIIVALLIALPIRFFIAEPFIVHGASMDPTFGTGQFLIIDRLSYRFESPKRGDVVVFKYPNNPSTYYIKRIIGLPGEIIGLEDGKVKICGEQECITPFQALDEPYISNSHISHDTMRTILGPSEYFVMGDNRAQSSDSREWGSLKAELIVGRPIIRLLPIDGITILPGEHRYNQ
ncbi:MAG: signal peptidase I [Candidatus Paceibacterota bacterium]|jgi:signal peptidase I